MHRGRPIYFVTGRLKDLIIIQGRNHYPQDIEATAGGAHPALHASGTAAFTIEVDGAEQVALIQEVSARHLPLLEAAGGQARSEALRAIRGAVAEAHGITVHGCAFVPERTIPKTSMPFRTDDAQTIHFDFPLQPNSEQVITYTVNYQQ